MTNARNVNTAHAEEPPEGRKELGIWQKLSGILTPFPRAVHLGHQIWSSLLSICTPLVSRSSEELGSMEDLEEMIPRDRRPLDPDIFDYSDESDDFMSAVMVRVIQAGGRLSNWRDVETAYYREKLARCPLSHPGRSTLLKILANDTYRHFEQRGQTDDLEEAIAYYRQLLDLHPTGHPNRSASLNNLANSIIIRFEQTDQVDDLEEAIAHHRESLGLRPIGHPNRSDSLNNLANSIITRFEQTGQVDDLEEAIAHHRESLGLRPIGHPNRSDSLSNLANSILTRFEQTGQAGYLEEAIAYYRESLGLHPTDHPNRSTSLNNLANSILTRFKQTGQVDDLEEAIAYYQESLGLHPVGHPDRSASLSNLANSIQIRFKQTAKTEDLDDAMKYFSLAETSLPAGHPMRAEIWNHLATISLERHSFDPSDEHLSNAFALYESSANYHTASVMARFKFACNWASAARHHKHESTLRAYSTSLTLLDRYVVAMATVERKFFASVTTKSLALDAASSAIEAGQPEIAIEFLDRGRTIILSAMGRHRHTLGELRAVDPGLAHEFEILSIRLERLAMASESERKTEGFQLSFEVQQREQRILLEKWEEVVNRIREVKGFDNFLQAIPITTLQKAAAGGPVIVVNISRHRSDAIIVRDAEPPVIVPLPEASPDYLAPLSSKFSDPRASSRTGFSKDLSPILQKLWKIIVGPVTDQLAALGVAKRTRIWWCPTSHLCALPLHAAGPYTTGTKPLPDLYISSYTATLSALIVARSCIIPRTTAPNLLVIGDAGEGDSFLPNVEEELCRIMSFGDYVDVLSGETASRENVMSGLQRYSWAHFSCHGNRDPMPFHSSFQLYAGKRLKLHDLLEARLPNAELAFLSACHAAAAGVEGPDEVIHLAGALQFCGFRSVVGTMWAMADIDGPDVAADFYQYMFRERGGVVNFTDSAKAINIATRKMRMRKGMTLGRWVNFIHIGA